MAERIVMPSFGMYTAEGQLAGWLEQDGASVQAGQPVLEIETQKSTESVIAPATGTLRHIAPRGAELKEQSLLGYILAEGEALPSDLALPRTPATPGSLAEGEGVAERERRPVSDLNRGRIIASPYARRLAKEHGLEVRQIPGTGPGGRIVAQDVQSALRRPSAIPSPSAARNATAFSAELGLETPASRRNGRVHEGRTFQSQSLGKALRYAVYLPPNYEASSRTYPVVYLLHGYGDNETGWLRFGEVDQLADEAIARGTIPPMILVMPDGGSSFYINNHDQSVRYESFFIEEFLPFIESQYRVRREPRSRGLAGISMGGFGALAYTLRHPGLFAASVAFSAALLTDEEILAEPETRWSRVYAPVYGPNLNGTGRITDHLRSYRPSDLVPATSRECLGDLKLYLDCGDEDQFYKGNAIFHILLRDRNIPHQYRVRAGGHTWGYWRSGLLEAMRFLGASFYW